MHAVDAGEQDSVVMPQKVDGPVELLDPKQVVLPVLVIACNRPTIKRNLDQLLK